MPEPFRVDVTPSEQVTAIVYPAAARDAADISLILAHGAGANQRSGFMVQFAGALAARGIETITFNFVYSEAGRRLPDRNDKLEACWRSVIAACRSGSLGGSGERRKLAIGGKSMGGRIASQVAAADPDAIAGLERPLELGVQASDRFLIRVSASKPIGWLACATKLSFSFAAGTWIGGPWSLLAVQVELRRTTSASAFSIALSRAVSAVPIADLRKGG